MTILDYYSIRLRIGLLALLTSSIALISLTAYLYESMAPMPSNASVIAWCLVFVLSIDILKNNLRAFLSRRRIKLRKQNSGTDFEAEQNTKPSPHKRTQRLVQQSEITLSNGDVVKL